MVDVDMNLTPLKVIGKEAYLWTKGPFRLSKDHGTKRHPNTWRREELNKIKVYVKVEDWGVHHKIYHGCCTKQRVKIPKATWTSPILRRRSTCQTSSNMASLMKDDMKVKMPNGTPKTLIPSNGVVNWEGVLKYGGRLEGDYATHFKGWIKKPIT